MQLRMLTSGSSPAAETTQTCHAAAGNLAVCTANATNQPPPHPHPHIFLAVGNLPVRTANEIVKAMGWLRRRWGDFTLPVYVHHGAADK